MSSRDEEEIRYKIARGKCTKHIYNFRLGRTVRIKRIRNGRERERERSVPSHEVGGPPKDFAKIMRNGRGTEEDGNDKRRKVARVQEEECCETRGRWWWGGRARIRRAAYIRESYFNILSALRGITHTHEWTANIWNGPQTWRGWLPPFPLREKGKRIVRGRAKKLPLKIANTPSAFPPICSVGNVRERVTDRYLDTSSLFVVVSLHFFSSKSRNAHGGWNSR